MKDLHENKERVNEKILPSFFNDASIVSFVIILFSLILFYFTFNFDAVPPILNRGIQPATFPKILLLLIIFLTLIVYFMSLKKPWKKQTILPKNFYYTLIIFVLFSILSKNVDFFLGLSFLSLAISFNWGERRILHLTFVTIIFPLLVFLFFETMLNLRFPGGVITNLYYY